MDCSCEKTNDILFEADFADPVWCAVCKENLDLDEFPISNELKQMIGNWAKKYGHWLDWDKELLKIDAVRTEKEFNKEGRLLSIKLQHELPNVTICYKKSYLSSFYT
ncbi:hypothetical protein [Terribacillus sp. JSM ZJ617]|uniref:hypothetical protein n=1 Tax=Terribacillus sp. JSM ZJ617 TaxID=3342119 RepID=UPI0035A958E5